jgi:hypothetical protein
LPLLALWGAPRSGTTWLGQIIDSHPQVAYRFQPLFSYRFKSAVSEATPPEGVRRFLEALAATDDDFVCQRSKRAEGIVPRFAKEPARLLAFKEVRYLHLAGHFLSTVPGSKAIAIVRHPCAAINSWLKTPREFRPEWNWREEWRLAPSKNLGRPEEYYGFERWRWAADYFLQLAERHPDRFTLVRYESLVESPVEQVGRLFGSCGLSLPPQTVEFLHASQEREVEHPDSVFRLPDVKDRWREELAPEVVEAILAACRGSALERFCH